MFHRYLFAAALAAFISLLGACAQAPQQRSGGTNSVDAPLKAGGDRVTASDESDASKRARTRLELATLYFQRGQMTTALDEVKQAITAFPAFGEAFNLRGMIYANLGDDKLAQESFQRALQINAQDGDTLHNYGWYWCQAKRFEPAQEMFTRALASAQYRGIPRTLLTQGICFARAGNLPEAERSLVKSLELDTSNPATAVNLAEVLLRKGDLDRAQFYIKRVNSQTEVVSAQTLWLAIKIAKRQGNTATLENLSEQLRDRFPQSREVTALDKGAFDE
jgi:type IV pilus assembly protein PilF